MSRLTVPVSVEDHIQGPRDAPVTLLEYGDYECPYCGEAYPVIKAAQEALGDQLRFVFRNFPITEAHPHAGRAAEFAEAAATAGRFWEAHDLLYEHQDALEDLDLIAYGETVGLDRSAVLKAFDGRYDGKIRQDFMGGLRSGVNGTPTLFINGERYDGQRDVASLVAALERAVSGRG
ncbi:MULTISPECIES: DsbA family protein [unclassified Chelatococcus]|jgi:protein-disulfide isomerase|uniref:DsbA family protein n=1 Tax=unclassified Chelatococcus TaxID=2638111 RepID=UPI001BCEE535|nr:MULTISPECIES: DsbA family protein [unclassified Chelatococcus]CAH1658769.1 Thioredoxin domain-containing protein [Hyphomicrobiales bacterium]MBS7740842.1 DsbA family protein [Chelatococcus sp. HY11]MBX3545924.1 DsbA family protein [Chelatococcus sp.]MCO5079548.1 DsbA family protein [Chelatococcus sp.]CAH1684040.1 Thioredoxin domain-containing protein [Hyphomicrobiales bacterium]